MEPASYKAAIGTLRNRNALRDFPVTGRRLLLVVLAAFVGFSVPAGSRRARAAPPETGVEKTQAASKTPQAPLFESDVRPMFQAKCLRCHGEKNRKGELDLRTHGSVLKGGESGPVIVPGRADKSLLFEKVHEGVMPPGKKDRLTAAEVETIKRWIEAGARPGPDTPAESGSATPAPTQHDVIPILLRRCTVCHGARQREGGLDLRTRASMLRGGKSGPAIVPGKPADSLVLKKIRAGAMPPLRRIVEVSVKPIEPAETELLARWIELGAPEVRVESDVAGTKPDPVVTDRDRDFWAFRPPRPVQVPTVRNSDQVRNPVDAFVLHKLEQKGLTLASEADRPALMRRVCLDLTGLPPEPAEVKAFLADRDPRAYEKLVDRLLASPRYGERWGRHWLDVAGYADSEGKREQDQPRKFAYRYRDYIIRSLNADKPYDRFLLEQIAGDELADSEHAPSITPELYDNLVATGFLRMAPDPTWYNLTDFVPDRIEVIADEIEVLSSAVMGLTLKCARCHSHKFDPIPQRDYYRLVAVFKGAFDEYDWMKSNWHVTLSMGLRTDRDLPCVTTAERRRWEAETAALQKQIDALRAGLDPRPASPAAKKLAEETARRIRELEAKRPPEPKVRALWDRGEPSPTYIYRRGNYLSPGRLVGPGVPSVLTDGKTPFEVKPPWPGAKKTGRRLALARWLTRPDHPLTARVMVNRIWKHHFGVGLVKTLDNFGKTGAPPTHPELLDWLAREFTGQGSGVRGQESGVRGQESGVRGQESGIRNQESGVRGQGSAGGRRDLLTPDSCLLTPDSWRLKAMHRLMVTSAVYRQSSLVTPAHEKLDPDNVLYSRMPLQRMSAEQLYDTMLLVAGRLDETAYGPPDPLEVRPDGLATPAGTAQGWRRAVYVQQQRKVVATHLENFDFPQMNPNCIERRDSTVAPQALYLMNNGMVDTLAGQFARRVEKEAGADPRRQVEWVYLVALGRPPTAEETQLGVATLARMTDQWARHGARAAKPDAAQAAHQALATYCHALMNSAEFLYID